jgi:hypothetical protein
MLKQSDLAQFTGTETWYRHGLVPKVLYTDGARYVASEGGAYWLLDRIAAGQLEPHIRREEFQVWKLVKVNGDQAVVSATDGGKEGREPKVLMSERIEFTDFPLDEISFYVESDGEYRTILLPSEH